MKGLPLQRLPARAAFLLAGCPLFAADSTAAADASFPAARADGRTNHPILAPQPVAGEPKRDRLVSPETAARLASVLPQPPAPSPPASVPASAPPAESSPADPEHPILLLPKLFVRDDRLPKVDPSHTVSETPREKKDVFLQEDKRRLRVRAVRDLTTLLPTTTKADRKVIRDLRGNADRGATWIDMGGSYQASKR